MSATSKLYKQIQTALTIHRRDFRITIFGPVLYIVTTISIAIGIVIIRNYLNYIESNGLYPMPDLFSFPFRWIIILTSVYLAFSVVIAIARERESGAMELVDQTVGSAIASASFSLSNLGTLATRDSAGVIDLGDSFN